MKSLPLAGHFIRRELRERYRGSFTGFGWAVLQPLLQLAIYAFVFVNVFKAKVPGADAPGYVPFLVMAMWPWIALSEALTRATTSVQDNAALTGKVALPRELLVFATCATSFLLHGGGFIAIVIVLALGGQGVHLAMLPFALLLYLPLFALAFGFALLFSAVQVFVRDLAQVLAQLLTLIMFASPVFYDRSLLPSQYQLWLSLNPFTFYAESMRALLLGHGQIEPMSVVIAVAVALGALALGHWVFRRLDPHFEDFL